MLSGEGRLDGGMVGSGADCGGRRGQEGNGDPQAAADYRRGGGVPAVSPGDRVDDRQAEPAAASRAHVIGVQPPEWLEQRRRLLRGDLDPARSHEMRAAGLPT